MAKRRKYSKEFNRGLVDLCAGLTRFCNLEVPHLEPCTPTLLCASHDGRIVLAPMVGAC